MASTTKKLKGYVTFTPEEGGSSQTFGPGDELPDWAAKQAAAGKHYEGSEDEEPSDADLPVAGTGQKAGEGLTEDEKVAARKEADRVRKANARAADKKAAEDKAALDAAAAAEAQRKAEAEAQAQAGQGS